MANLYFEAPRKLWNSNQGAAGDYDREFPGLEEHKVGNDFAEGGKAVAGAVPGKPGVYATKSKFGASVVYKEEDEYMQGGQGGDQGGSAAIPLKD